MKIYPFIEDFCHKAVVKDNYEDRLLNLCHAFNHADYVVIGAGAGLSTAAGIAYSGKRFTDNFADFIERYSLYRYVFFCILSIQYRRGTVGVLGKAHPYEPLRYTWHRFIPHAV